MVNINPAAIRRAIVTLLIVAGIACGRATSAVAVTATVLDENVHISAGHMKQDLAEGLYTAEGNVTVQWQGINMTADKVVYSTATHMIYANGSVVLSKGASILKGKTLALNIDSGQAEMDSTLVTVPSSGLTITAEKLVRINENEFRAETTELTSCDMPDPSWKFGAGSLNVNLLGYATGRKVVFYIKDVPVFYLPWLAFPAVLEKQSGLLVPRLGYSNGRGAQLDIPAYWVISPSQDLQVDLDVMSRRGLGTGLEYRYIRQRGSEGRLGVYQIYDQVENRWRWQLSQEHKEIFSSDANLRISVNTTSDRAFLNDYGEKSGDYNRQASDSTFNMLKTWQNYAATTYLRYREDLYAADNRATLQTLPSLGMAGVRQAISSLPLYLDFDSSFENLYRETGSTGQRMNLYPKLSLLPFQSAYLRTALFAGVHIRGYASDKRDSGSEASAMDVLPEVGIRLSTSLTRIYAPDFQQLKKIRHELIPEISYGYVPERDQLRLPFYDYADRIISRNMTTLSVTSLLNGKFVSGEAAEYRNISRIKLSADYAFSGGRRDLLTLVESQRPWSDLVLESDAWLTNLLRVTFDSRFNLYEHQLSTAVAGLAVDDRQGNSVGVAYQMARNEVEYFEARLATKLIKPLNLSYTGRYSFDRKDFLESEYAVEYRQKCWGVAIAIHQRPGNQFYTVNFNLAGLGSK
jgi:LPS-assembly protein